MIDRDQQCLLNGCQLARAGQLAAGAQDMLEQAISEKRQAMSGALWCDLGGHAFSTRDQGRTTYKIETVDQGTGQPVEDQLTACGQHAAERRKLLAPASPASLAAPDTPPPA